MKPLAGFHSESTRPGPICGWDLPVVFRRDGSVVTPAFFTHLAGHSSMASLCSDSYPLSQFGTFQLSRFSFHHQRILTKKPKILINRNEKVILGIGLPFLVLRFPFGISSKCEDLLYGYFPLLKSHLTTEHTPQEEMHRWCANCSFF